MSSCRVRASTLDYMRLVPDSLGSFNCMEQAISFAGVVILRHLREIPSNLLDRDIVLIS